MSRSGLFTRPADGTDLTITPEAAGWRYLGVGVVQLAPGEERRLRFGDLEAGVVILEGRLRARVVGGSEDVEYVLARRGVFSDRGTVLYLPPDHTVQLTAEGDGATYSVGSAPAAAKYPVRLITPAESAVELRGGGAARRQVGHLLAPPMGAHRLIVYEAYVPRGCWSGWPPHRHDGFGDSPYLEETYYFRFDTRDGFAMHQNYLQDPGDGDMFVARDGDVVQVPAGFHFSTSCPGANMYFLNFLAGEPEHEARSIPPCFDPRHTWIERNWDAGALELPAAAPQYLRGGAGADG